MTIRFDIYDEESALEELVAVKQTIGTILARSDSTGGALKDADDAIGRYRAAAAPSLAGKRAAVLGVETSIAAAQAKIDALQVPLPGRSRLAARAPRG